MEKLGYGLAATLLYAQGRAAAVAAATGMIDLLLASLFGLAFRAVGRARNET